MRLTEKKRSQEHDSMGETLRQTYRCLLTIHVLRQKGGKTAKQNFPRFLHLIVH